MTANELGLATLPPTLSLGAETSVEQALAPGGVIGTVVAAMPLALVAIDRDGIARAWNAMAERMFGWRTDEVIGRSVPILRPEEAPAYHALVDAAFEEPLSGLELLGRRRDQSPIWVRLWTSRLIDGSGKTAAILVLLSDDTERKSRELELLEKGRTVQLLQEIAVTANESSGLAPALRRGMQVICDSLGWTLGHALVVEDGELVDTAIWSGPIAAAYEPFCRATESTHLLDPRELPPRVMATGKPLWINDLANSLVPPRSVAAQEAGLKAAFGLPLLVRDRVVAVLEFFTVDDRPLKAALLEAMANIGAQLGRVAERAYAQREKEQLLAQTHAAKAEASEVKRTVLLGKLSERERTVLARLAEGDDNLKIAAVLGISETTVKAHVSALLRKLELENRTQAAVLALSLGFGRGHS